MGTLVRDELSGQDFNAGQLQWVTDGFLTREQTATWGQIHFHGTDHPVGSDCKAWALGADGDEWYPVTVLT